jgi:hypothetical protein
VAPAGSRGWGSQDAGEFDGEVEDTHEVVEKFKDFLDPRDAGRLRRRGARPRTS